MVAAASLVATPGHPCSPNRTHFIYDLYDEITSLGQTISSTLADFHREGEHTSAVSRLCRAERKKRSSFFYFALSRSPWTEVQG